MARILNITGQKFNFLTALEKTDKRDKNGLVIWKFLCDCGNICEFAASKVKTGNIKSCGCMKSVGLRKYNENNKTLKIGDKIGKLTIIEDLGYLPYAEGRRRTKFLCQCECGNICEAWSNQLSSKSKLSCGCLTSKGELMIEKLLKENGFNYKHNSTFKELTEATNRQLRFDFIVYNEDKSVKCFIEFDGRQHIYGPDTQHWSRTTDTLNNIKERDLLKNNFCKDKGYILIRIPYYKLNLTIEELFSDKFIYKGDD